jgi:protein O-GlcNAc transferase
MLSCALGHQADVTGAIEACRRTVELAPDHASRHSTLLYTLNFQPVGDAAALFAEHLEWARRHAEPLTAQAAPHANDRTPERRLRIGYVSSHFREHAVSFFSEPMIIAHDHKDFEVFCYSEDQRSDAFTDRFRAAADRWVSIGGAADAAVAEQIRLDQIDILVDLAGHLGGNRLGVFARKPAPVQVTYLGYQNTTGMSAMDYRLTDEHADPPGLTEKYYSEQLERLPRTFFCYQPPEPSPEVNDLPALEIPHVTFASMNNVLKITPDVLQTWGRILAAVPNSRLRVLAYTGGRFEQDVRNVMAAAGISYDRIEILNKRPRYDYLELHHQHDIALDTFPFNGHTTTCDALWMGVPSIMLEGNSYASRFGGTSLVNLGLTDLIGRTRDEYVAIAVALANNLPRLAELRGSLRARMKDSPLLDATGFTRNLEQAYRRMWRKWCESK